MACSLYLRFTNLEKILTSQIVVPGEVLLYLNIFRPCIGVELNLELETEMANEVMTQSFKLLGCSGWMAINCPVCMFPPYFFKPRPCGAQATHPGCSKVCWTTHIETISPLSSHHSLSTFSLLFSFSKSKLSKIKMDNPDLPSRHHVALIQYPKISQKLGI